MASAYAARSEAAVEDDYGVVGSAPRPRISWSAVIAGVVLVLALNVLLGVLGAGIGFGALHPGAPDTPATSEMIDRAGLWSLGTAVVSLLVGCWAAARLANVGARKDGALHGLVIWGLSVLVTVWLLSSALGGAMSMLGGVVSSVGGGLRAVAPQITQVNGDAVAQQAQSLLQSPQGGNGDVSNMSAGDAQKEVARLLPQLATGGDQAQQARGRIADIMAAQLKISHDDAVKRLDDAEAKVKQTATNAANVGADAASRGALLAFGGLLIGAVAAAIGGALARPRGYLLSNRTR